MRLRAGRCRRWRGFARARPPRPVGQGQVAMRVGAEIDQIAQGGGDGPGLARRGDRDVFGPDRQRHRPRFPCARHLDRHTAPQTHAARGGGGGQEVGLADEARDKAVGRFRVDRARVANLQQLARRHHADPVGHRQRLFLVMRDENKGDAGLVLQPFQLDLHLLAQLQVQRRQGFVEKQHLRLGGECPGQGHALLLAARQLAGLARGHRVQFHQRQHAGGAGRDLGLGAALHFQPETHVLGHRQMREQGIALEHRVDGPTVRRQVGDVLPVEQDLPAGGCLEPRNQAQERGLAAARRPRAG